MYIYTSYTLNANFIYKCIYTYIQILENFIYMCIYTSYIQKLYISYIQIRHPMSSKKKVKNNLLSYLVKKINIANSQLIC